MTLSIKPASRIEDEVFNRLIDAIPLGQFYLKAEYVQPRWNGDTTVNFIITGTQGNMVSIYLGTGNGSDVLITRVGMENDTTYAKLELHPPPDVNFIRMVDGSYNASTDTWTSNGAEAGTTVVVANYASVLYGVSKDWFEHIWLPYLTQYWSLTSEWGSRLIEWYFKYHKRFPDTQALRTLAVRLASRATWNDLPSTQGGEDMIAALCGSEPLVMEVTNQRPYLDLALWPLLPVSSDLGGFELNVWYPDLPTAKEQAILRLAANLDYLNVDDYGEPNTYLTCQTEAIVLSKDPAAENLQYLLRQIGPMDSWKAWAYNTNSLDYCLRWWDNAWDCLVTYPGMGAGNHFDSGELLDAGDSLDSFDQFANLWIGLGVNVSDGITWDSLIQVAHTSDQIPPDDPPAWDWEYTTLEVSCSTSNIVTNTLHGGASSGYEE